MSWSGRCCAFAKTRTAGCLAGPCGTTIPPERMAELGDLGFMEFRADEAAGLMRVLTLVWAGACPQAPLASHSLADRVATARPHQLGRHLRVPCQNPAVAELPVSCTAPPAS